MEFTLHRFYYFTSANKLRWKRSRLEVWNIIVKVPIAPLQWCRWLRSKIWNRWSSELPAICGSVVKGNQTIFELTNIKPVFRGGDVIDWKILSVESRIVSLNQSLLWRLGWRIDFSSNCEWNISANWMILRRNQVTPSSNNVVTLHLNRPAIYQILTIVRSVLFILLWRISFDRAGVTLPGGHDFFSISSHKQRNQPQVGTLQPQLLWCRAVSK